MIHSSAAMAALRRRAVFVGAIGLLVPIVRAQTAPAPTAAMLAKYDLNKNGVLDPNELAQKASDESRDKDTVLMTPFNVSTDKDVGYTAGNTLSGGRVDTPLAITPGSISVMTKEFMDDFNITDMNQAGSWSIGFDLGTPVPNSNPSAESVYQNIVRGADSADNFPTRNGQINFGAADSYNTDRFEFNRGPDTSMFGDGGPGGRQGSSSKQANYNRTAASLTGQFDSWNGYRSTLDYSKGWDRVGLRFNALYQNAPGYQSGTDKIKKAWTINLKAKLARNTELSVEYERANEWNALWSITNGDTQNLWDGVTINENNGVTLGALSSTALSNAGLEKVSTQTNNFVYNYATGTMMDYGNTQYKTKGILFGGNAMRIPYIGNEDLVGVPARRASIANMDPRFKLAPKDNVAARDTDTASIRLEHRVGNLFVRLGASQNNFDNNTLWSNSSPNAYIIDVNKLMPNGKLNPKFLQPYVDVEQNNLYSQDATREFNGSATYRFFRPTWWDFKQQITVNLSNRDEKRESRTSAWRRVDNPTSSDPFNNVNRLFYRVYWNDPRATLAPVFTDPNKVIPGTWKYVDTAGTITERNIKQGSVTGQTGFFNEKLVFTGSFSKTQQESERQQRIGTLTVANAPNYTNVLGTDNIAGKLFESQSKRSSVAYGMVTYPFRNSSDNWVKKIVSPLGFVVNIAENNQAPATSAQRPLITGEEAPTPHTRTEDFGIRYSIPGGKAYLTLSHYKTTQENRNTNFGSTDNITRIWTNLGYTDPTLTTTTEGNFWYSDPNSKRLEGWEAELTANPTRNISLSINYSHPRSYIVTESEGRKAYVAEHLAEWEAGASSTAGTVRNGHAILDPAAIRADIDDIFNNDLAGLRTGTLDDGTINHRINANARYAFREGALKGLAVVAGVQYRGYQKSGSRDAQIKFNTTSPTTAQNTEAAYDYLWVPPTWKSGITTGANYTRRFGKYNYRFQLNITNVLNNLDPIWGRSGVGGNAYLLLTQNALFAGNPREQILAGFANPEPRKFTFTTTVSF